jgi:hypothetical protein
MKFWVLMSGTRSGWEHQAIFRCEHHARAKLKQMKRDTHFLWALQLYEASGKPEY